MGWDTRASRSEHQNFSFPAKSGVAERGRAGVRMASIQRGAITNQPLRLGDVPIENRGTQRSAMPIRICRTSQFQISICTGVGLAGGHVEDEIIAEESVRILHLEKMDAWSRQGLEGDFDTLVVAKVPGTWFFNGRNTSPYPTRLRFIMEAESRSPRPFQIVGWRYLPQPNPGPRHGQSGR